jgi:hypothetical protein
MKIIQRIARTDFARSAVADQADLSAFKARPTPRICAGLFLIGFSYVIGWPAVSLLGAVAMYAENPMIIVVGGPAVYGLSHLVFILGMYVAGTSYTRTFMRWAVRAAVESLPPQEKK